MDGMLDVKILDSVFPHAGVFLADTIAIAHVSKCFGDVCHVLIGPLVKVTHWRLGVNQRTNHKLTILRARHAVEWSIQTSGHYLRDGGILDIPCRVGPRNLVEGINGLAKIGEHDGKSARSMKLLDKDSFQGTISRSLC